MREIKFRAWDNVEMKMYYTGEEEDIHFYFDSMGIVAEKLDGGAEKLEHLVYMQYTGLKDSSDDGMWEGDILQDFINGNKRYKVIWDEIGGQFLFEPISANGKDNAMDYYEFETVASTGGTFVIGNIYEK